MRYRQRLLSAQPNNKLAKEHKLDNILHLVGKTSSEVFQLRYPRSILKFCDFDLTFFAENAIELCNEALKTGEIDFDRMTDLRNTLGNAHVYIEHNIRTVYDKIVIDCWIDYVCRRDGVGDRDRSA